MILKKTSLSDEVFQILKSRIIDRHYQPGHKLRQEAVCRELGVSASPVREAFNKLEKEGWIENIPRCGRVVRTFDDAEIEQTYVVRSALEELSVELAVANINLKTIKKMKESANKMYEMMLVRNLNGDLEADAEFHTEIVNASGNEVLRDIFVLLLQKGRAMISKDYPGDDNELQSIAERVHSEHMRIIAAMEAKDVDEAKALIHAHIAQRKALNYI